jgi:hypothetical protein
MRACGGSFRCGSFIGRGHFGDDRPPGWSASAAKKEFRAGLPGRYIDQLEPAFLFEKIDYFLVGDIFHRPAAQPIADIGKDIHSAIDLIRGCAPREFRKSPPLALHLMGPDVPPHHMCSF